MTEQTATETKERHSVWQAIDQLAARVAQLEAAAGRPAPSVPTTGTATTAPAATPAKGA